MSSDLMVTYQVGAEKVVLSPDVVRNYLVSGGGSVTDQEIIVFMKLCKARGLNPWIKDAYLIKYGKDDPAAMVVGKDVFLRRAQKNKNYEGHEINLSEDGKEATCLVYVKGYKVPIRVTVDFDEYVGRKRDGSVNRQWKTKPKTMLRKCALVAGLREAFTEDLGSLYIKDEISKDDKAEEMELPKEVNEVSNISGGETKKRTKKKPNEHDTAWAKTWESFYDTLGGDAFNRVLHDKGFSCVTEVPEDMREDMFEAWSKEASE